MTAMRGMRCDYHDLQAYIGHEAGQYHGEALRQAAVGEAGEDRGAGAGDGRKRGVC